MVDGSRRARKVGDILAIHDAIAKKRGGRRIPTHPDLRRALRSLLRISEPSGPVIRSARGGYLRPTSVVNWFAALFRELGFDGCSSHSGRRTFITAAARNIHRSGCSLRDVQLLAGHRSIETTEHLGNLRDLAARIVGGAGGLRGSARRGVNLLFYGPPGTGKSEFAKTLGAHLRFSVQFCGEMGEEKAEPDRRERIAALLIANAVGRVARKTIVVVDEADDLLAGLDEDNSFNRRGSKVFMNRLVERAAAPTIWITNDVDRLGPAIIRRMSLALRFSKPTLSVRKTMVARMAECADFRLNETALLDLARTLASPALIENAIRSAAHIRGSASDARAILGSAMRALSRRDVPIESASIRFDPTLSSADVDLVQLADQVARSPARALSFCLSGPPGAGKSAYARHLADRLDLDVLEKRFSDLSSMWLGESEKTIAAAFEEAADLRAFLIIDEADSLLRDRLAAQHSWEITQVNEMLTQMERHPYPFACTTNALELLDAAAARRFLFKVRFQSMSADQISKAFRHAFGAAAPRTVLKLSGLTPADFATVSRKASVLGEHDVRLLTQWPETEAEAKPSAGQPIGF